MKDEYLLIGAIAVLSALIFRKKKAVAGMNDPATSIENIRRGVRNGWYTAALTRVNGKPAVILSGKRTDGTYLSEPYPIAETDWQTLKSQGYPVE